MFVLGLFLFTGILVEPFKIAEPESEHHQRKVSAAMAPDGRFAVAWIDSTTIGADKYWSKQDVFVRFFGKEGSPLTPAQKIIKLADTTRMPYVSLCVDSSGNYVLALQESPVQYSDSDFVRIGFFDKDGSMLTIQTAFLAPLTYLTRCLDISCNTQGNFALTYGGGNIWVRRFLADGTPSGETFLAHADFGDSITHFRYPSIAMNDTGDIVVSWLKYLHTDNAWPYFQVFDSKDSSAIPWEPGGHLFFEADTEYTTRPEVRWLDNDRFVAFWIDHFHTWTLKGRIFSKKGAEPHSIQNLVEDNTGDSIFAAWANPAGNYMTAVNSERYVAAYPRIHVRKSDNVMWVHAAGSRGEIVGDEPLPSTGVFEISPPFGPDTLLDANPQTPAVACNDDRIVWVYPRMEPDGLFKVYAVVTDWNMVGISEPVTPATPPPHVTHLEIANPIGSSITLRYSNCPNGFSASVYDASGRKIDELSTPNQSGVLVWGSSQRPGVYFIVPQVEKASPSKVVLVK
ncbi:T9SS type A sorting domain-containing protein [bacterium]|nr:T9SS type A sorting domain-containing protein [bacterium]